MRIAMLIQSDEEYELSAVELYEGFHSTSYHLQHDAKFKAQMD